MNDIPPYDLADHIRKLRKAATLTQEQLADKAEIGVTTLRQIETRIVRKPDFDTLAKLAIALGRDRSEFIVLVPNITDGAGPIPIVDALIPQRRATDKMSTRARELAELYDQLPPIAQLALEAVVRAYREMLA